MDSVAQLLKSAAERIESSYGLMIVSAESDEFGRQLQAASGEAIQVSRERMLRISEKLLNRA